MPRIDPALLLNTLSVLLSPSGGIKECEDVQRVVNLMTKFSKKLISKCVYIRILLATDRTLLDSFYGAGGWQLLFTWLSDAISKQNWPLVEALLELLHASPVSMARLASNQCPQHVRDLPKHLLTPDSQLLVDEIIASWTRIIDNVSISEPTATAPLLQSNQQQSEEAAATANNNNASVQADNKWRMEVRDRVVVFKKIDTTKSARASAAESEEAAGESEEAAGESEEALVRAAGDGVGDSNQPDANVNKENDQHKLTEKTEKNDEAEAKQIRVGSKKQLSKEDSGSVSDENAKSATNPHDTSSLREHKGKKRERSESQSDSRSRKRKDRDKSSDKRVSSSSEHRSSSDKSASKSSKHHSGRSSSNSRKDSHSKSHDVKSKERDRKSRELAEKAKQREKQTLKDRETLAKVCSVGKLETMAAIPKKSSDSATTGSKSETGDKSDPATKRSELRRATVKTYRGKFRSTGLENDSSSATKSRPEKSAVVSRPRPQLPSIAAAVSSPAAASEVHKRVLPDNASAADKRSRLEQRLPAQRPGGVKVTSPKPIQEATGFMDALNASSDVKKKPVKKPRRLSSREDKKDEKEPSSGTKTSSEQKVEEKEEQPPPVPTEAKPTLKFYQDTLDENNADDSSANETKEETASDDKTLKEEKEDEEEAPAPATIPLERLPSVDGDVSDPAVPGAPRGVLVLHRAAGRRRRSVTWRPDAQLVSVSYFELDENERVNVNRTKFEEMQALEKQRERDLMRRARATLDDGMREQMAWRGPLLLVDSAGPLVQPGVNSSECHVQRSRERSVFPFPYGATASPDTPTEPDPEHVDPGADGSCRPIPLHGDQQYGAVISDFRSQGWPAPRTVAPPAAAAEGFIKPELGLVYPGHEGMFPANGVPQAGLPGPSPQMMPMPQQHPRLVPPWGGNGVAPEMAGMFPAPGMPRPPIEPLPGAPGVWNGPRGPGRGHGPMVRGAPPLGFTGAPGMMGMPPRPMRGGVGPPGAMPVRGPGAAGRGVSGRGSRGNGSWRRETVCKHFMSGFCWNGRMCGFLHPGLAKRQGDGSGAEPVTPLISDTVDDHFV